MATPPQLSRDIPDEPRWIRFALVAAILAVLIIGAIIFLQASGSQRFYQQQTAERAKDYRETARMHAQRVCSTVPPEELFECFHDQYHAAWEREYNQQDLQAQLVMAVWTRAMGLAALIAMVVGVFGVGLVYTTFRETRRAALATTTSAKHAARAAEAAVHQHRAWLKVVDLSVTEVKFDEAINRNGEPDYISATIRITLENVGGTPATDVVWQPSIWGLGLLNMFPQWVAMWKRGSSEFAERAKADRAKEGEYGFVMFPGDKPKLSFVANTLTWPVEGSLHIPSAGEDERFRLMGVVTVLYRITSRDEAMTTVPFFVSLGADYLTKGFFRKNPVHAAKDIRIARIQAAERAT